MSQKSLKIVADGVYQCSITGTFSIRPWVDGVRKWRTLEATTLRNAIEEAQIKKSDHARAKIGAAKSPFVKTTDFATVAAQYVAEGCPNKRLEARPGAFSTGEVSRIKPLVLYFGKRPLSEIKIALLPSYQVWRRPQFQKANCTGSRTIDMEFNTLSNVMHFAVMKGLVDFNPVAVGRPRYQTADKISHSRERAITSGDDLHRLAEYFFDSPRLKTEVMGWLTLFSALTGCRNVELQNLRMDGIDEKTPGWIDDNHLFLRRAKSGIHPWIEMKAELQDAVEHFRYWHSHRYPKDTPHYSPWWFPGQDWNFPLGKASFFFALQRACKDLKIPACSPHGFRSFYVTLRRGEGASDIQIADEIGDKTVAIIALSYGAQPPNWKGQKKLSFLPSEGLPAWARWRPNSRKVVNL